MQQEEIRTELETEAYEDESPGAAPSAGQEALKIATHLYEQRPDWVTFFREVLGVEGVVRKLFRSQKEMEAFERTAEYAGIQQMLALLRADGDANAEAVEPFKVITVRLPKSLRETLRAEAKSLGTSMNQLCISKLLQFVDGEVVPGGRKPPTPRAKRQFEDAFPASEIETVADEGGEGKPPAPTASETLESPHPVEARPSEEQARAPDRESQG